MTSKPKILVLDIETAPMIGAFWGLWKQNIGLKQLYNDWYILTYAAKWLGEEETYWDSLTSYKEEYKANPECDYMVLQSLRDLLDEADIIVAHNGAGFDIPKINARFLKYGILPPSPYKQVDTLRVVKKKFRLTSNKLEYVANYLGLGGKIKHQGFDLWTDCMKGDVKAWSDMIKYNIKDVTLLEEVYYRLLPWMDQHPNLALYYDNAKPRCPKCGGTHINYRGYAYTPMGKFHRFQCQDCGGWGRDRSSALSKEQRKAIQTNAAL